MKKMAVRLRFELSERQLRAISHHYAEDGLASWRTVYTSLKMVCDGFMMDCMNDLHDFDEDETSENAATLPTQDSQNENNLD